ncbi:MAG: glutamate synthase large subunit [Eubacteriales bacterium]|nr:glutamate synthase large subunit [Eubacteriales bacterium]
MSYDHDSCGIGAVVDIEGRPSHEIVSDALSIVEKLDHRAGKDATGKVGDGVGIMTQTPDAFFRRKLPEEGFDISVLGGSRDYAAGMFFFPQNMLERRKSQKKFEVICGKEGLPFLFWREVPVNPEILGKPALDTMPCIVQGFVGRPEDTERGLDFDRRLYIVRRIFENSCENTYVASLSSRTIVYKGMFLVNQLRDFYKDLQDPSYESAMAMVHSRFSTNTMPSWERAHPNRIILHNGEINTIRGNVDRMMAREETMHSKVMEKDMDKILPVISATGSDSAMLDNTLEFLVMNGLPLPLAVMILIPEPWQNDSSMDRVRRDLYRYYSTLMEPWDGPASIFFSDGDVVGAVLDRNGLRPSRYYLTDDGRLILSSEVGVLDIPPEKIVKKSRLEPGRMLLIDMNQKKLISDDECKTFYATRHPYGEWLDRNLIPLGSLTVPNENLIDYTQVERDRLYKAFGYTYEEIVDVIMKMARDGSEIISAMGADIPIPVLSRAHQPLFSYFKQLFAQVTNPPIDAIREKIVTDTMVYAGSDGDLLAENEDNCQALSIHNPILSDTDLMKIRALNKPGFSVATISLLYYSGIPLKKALDDLFVDVERAYRKGANIIILSDRGVDEYKVAIPSLLAVSSVEQYLIRTKKRTAVSIILESAEPRDVHHIATLLGYGAVAVNPYLAHACIRELIDRGMLEKSYYEATEAYDQALLDGVVKIASKMGISTLQSYQSAQIFEAIGIRRSVVDEYFTNTVSPVEGVGLEEIAENVEWKHDHAFDPLGLGTDQTLDDSGNHRLRSGNDAEDHMFNPQVLLTLRMAAQGGSYKLFKQYSEMVNDRRMPHTLRGLLDFRFDPDGGIPISEVEPVSEIVKRFKTGAMSYGSISEEAHTCMAVAMNRLGGRSNSGEGGEDPSRYGTEKNSAIKQVASGRFGVTSQYLLSAKEIQIKMAQGAKPGEGGHLPGKKVHPWIAKTRYSTPGVALISPPPHHDIYSIEDLAQLIFDLKNANRSARISVKLVSESGVGTVACGVAKAGAQVILISGYDGGTGAAPMSSIYNAGLPWELGLSETHRALSENGLRERVRLETDGKLMTGRDVVIAALLGAEEFGFATAPLVTMGCLMMRVCNLDTCPAGIATQNEELRKRFKGKPEYVMNFMRFIAEEVRELMAKLGVRKLDDLVGRTDLLAPRTNRITHRADEIDLTGILGEKAYPVHFNPDKVYDFHLEKTADLAELVPSFKKSMNSRIPHETKMHVSSSNRAFGTILGSEISKKFGEDLEDDTYRVFCEGSGGQSFGAFVPKGLTLDLTGDSNDYFGKGLSGGKLIVRPDKKSPFTASENTIIGNVALYGATSGKAFICGKAGERFCVRNSGAEAVVEGVGDHGCEYMTGGRVLVIGEVGKNFAAGMSGGIAYVLDEKMDLYLRMNKALAGMYEIHEEEDKEKIHAMLEEHYQATGSKQAEKILADFDRYLRAFRKIVPYEYERIMNDARHSQSQAAGRA